jgi:hypothetical protein
VVSAVAEGLDWIVTADPMTATDLQPVVDKLGFSDRIRASRGYRLINQADKMRGDYTVFPVDECAAGPNPDFSLVEDSSSPEDAIEGLRALCPGAVLMANRPIFPKIGLLSVQGFDMETGAIPESDDLVMDVDAFQVWEGKRSNAAMPTWTTYLQLLSRGYRMTPLANSLSAGTFNEEPGYPRVYIRSEDTDPRSMDIKELTRNIKAGRVQLTNGPFIDFRINGQDAGSMVTDEDGDIEIELNVWTPNWANVSSISILQNGRVVRQVILPAGSTDEDGGLIYPTKKNPDENKFRIRIMEDSILNVLVQGDPALPQDPVNPFIMPTYQPGVTQGQYSMALTAPVLVDVDGDGRITLPEETAAPEDPGAIPF